MAKGSLLGLRLEQFRLKTDSDVPKMWLIEERFRTVFRSPLRKFKHISLNFPTALLGVYRYISSDSMTQLESLVLTRYEDGPADSLP